MSKSIRTDLPLETRAKHLVSALRDYLNAERSLRVVDSGDDHTGLHGSKDEVEYALSFYCNEAKDIYSSMMSGDIDTLKANGLLTSEQITQIVELPSMERPIEPSQDKDNGPKDDVTPQHSPSN